jgi:hypothetical protein
MGQFGFPIQIQKFICVKMTHTEDDAKSSWTFSAYVHWQFVGPSGQ